MPSAREIPQQPRLARPSEMENAAARVSVGDERADGRVSRAHRVAQVQLLPRGIPVGELLVRVLTARHGRVGCEGYERPHTRC